MCFSSSWFIKSEKVAQMKLNSLTYDKIVG